MSPVDRHALRRDKLRHALRRTEIDALLVTSFTNVTYLTGFTGDSSYLLIGRQGDLILSDGRYATQLDEQCPGLDRHIRRTGSVMHAEVAAVVRPMKLRSLGFESDSMTVATRDALAEKLPRTALVPRSGLVEKLRMIKDDHELAEIRRAIGFAERGFAALRATLRGDKTERQVANELEYAMRAMGAGGVAFPSIVAVGSRAALPHYQPGDVRIDADPLLLVDWGAEGTLYRSDLTRVVLTGKISPEIEKIHRVVLTAQAKAIAAIRPGAKAVEIDRTARAVIERAGFGNYFDHGLGHGFGLDIHESPRLSPSSKAVLQAGMVITVEPGIYLPGVGGVRIEDDVLVTASGHEVLTSVPKTIDEAYVRLM